MIIELLLHTSQTVAEIAESWLRGYAKEASSKQEIALAGVCVVMSYQLITYALMPIHNKHSFYKKEGRYLDEVKKVIAFAEPLLMSF